MIWSAVPDGTGVDSHEFPALAVPGYIHSPLRGWRIAALPDDQIDTFGMPELASAPWKDAVRGRFYRPIKQSVSLRLDADVVA
jgi:hypothetical protein